MAITIYGSILSPFTRKVTLVAMELGLDFESVDLIPYAPPGNFSELSPLRRIPILTDGDYKLTDSSAISAYLIEAYGLENQLLPFELKQKGWGLWIEEYSDTALFDVVSSDFFRPIFVYPMLGKEVDIATAENAQMTNLPPCLAYLEEQLKGTEWFCGTEFSLADISVYAQLANLNHTGYFPTDGRYPNVVDHFERMKERDSVSSLLEDEIGYIKRMQGALAENAVSKGIA